MNNINIRPEDVDKFARHLSEWSRAMRNTSRSITRSSKMLNEKWKDSNFNSFLDVARTQGKALDNAIDQFENLAKQLSEMSADLKREHQKHSKRFRK